MAKKKTKNKIFTFNEAINKAEGKKHLLLGNGFSIAFKADIFSYSSLYDECIRQKGISNHAIKLFEKIGTTDFEAVIKSLNNAAIVLSAYTKEKKLRNRIEKDAKELKSALIKLLSLTHPTNPSTISEEQYQSCISFISPFDKIYTLNYDILLYWVIMKALESDDRNYDDGFRHEEDADYVVWSPEDSKHQNVYYLHGALHLFDAGSETKKFTWNRTGIKLMNQIKEQLEQNSFPLFIAEGTSNEKKIKINHSQYLGKGSRSLAEITGSLYIYGHSLAENDWHYLSLISKNKINQLFISLFNDGSAKYKKDNKKIKQQAQKLVDMRADKNPKKPLEVFYYDAQTAEVWNKPAKRSKK